MSEIANEALAPLMPARPEPAELDSLIANALVRLDRTMPQFRDHFPAPSSTNGTYAPIDNVEWTNGFWTGMLWLGWEFTGRDAYRRAAEDNVASFRDRVERRVNVDHHDLGFLYTLSACAAHRLTGSDIGRAAGLEAARLLLARFDAIAGVIQAWGA
jgi:unsaturated chondroitin disaccharide hydrolase